MTGKLIMIIHLHDSKAEYSLALITNQSALTLCLFRRSTRLLYFFVCVTIVRLPVVYTKSQNVERNALFDLAVRSKILDT